MQEDAEEALPGAGLHQRGVGLVLHFAARVEDKPGPRALGREGDLPVLPGDGDSVCGLLDGIQSKTVCVVIVVYIEAAGESCEQQDRRGGEQELPAKRRSFLLGQDVFSFCKIRGNKKAAISGDTTVFMLHPQLFLKRSGFEKILI